MMTSRDDRAIHESFDVLKIEFKMTMITQGIKYSFQIMRLSHDILSEILIF